MALPPASPVCPTGMRYMDRNSWSSGYPLNDLWDQVRDEPAFCIDERPVDRAAYESPPPAPDTVAAHAPALARNFSEAKTFCEQHRPTGRLPTGAQWIRAALELPGIMEKKGNEWEWTLDVEEFHGVSFQVVYGGSWKAKWIMPVSARFEAGYQLATSRGISFRCVATPQITPRDSDHQPQVR